MSPVGQQDAVVVVGEELPLVADEEEPLEELLAG